MTQRLWHENRILEALAAGATVVTASERLARSVRLAHGDTAQAHGARVWASAQVLNWNAFLKSQYQRYQETSLRPGPRLLAAHQAEALWEGVIHTAQGEEALLQPAAAARAAAAAAELCSAYGIRPEDLDAETTAGDDTRRFSAWLHTYIERCRSGNLLDPAWLAEHLLERYAKGEAAPPTHCLYVGFEEMTPQQARFLDAQRAAGCRVELLPPAGGSRGRSRRLQCDDAQGELEAAARWARALLERKPDARIGIVVRDLQEQRPALVRTLDRILCPGLDPDEHQARPYNLSLGRALSDCPLVSDALIFLACLQWQLPFAQASRLLRSPFLAAGESEASARARMEIHLRDDNLDQVGMARLSRLAQDGKAPELQAMLQRVQQLLHALPARQLPSGWAKTFAALLSAFGWPGERTPDSEEYQALKALQDLLGEFAQLDAVLSAVNAGEALARFARMAARNEFQPAAADVPLQVLGIPESSGQYFDHLWIMGLTEDVWPASPRPDPFIPWKLQRDHRVPHASAALEMEQAMRSTRRLLESGADILVSTAKHDADAELRPSPLLADIEPMDLVDLVQSPVIAWQALLQRQAAAALTEFTDTRGPPLANTAVSGGTKILKAQAACPFQAFAMYRLGAMQLATPSPGLSAAERGVLLHETMAALWTRLRDHAALLRLSSEERRQMVVDIVQQILRQSAGRHPDSYPPNFLQLEQQRLARLVEAWLDLEAARTPFSVEMREQKRSVSLGNLRLDTRVDRVDRMPDGGYVLIDYKSGQADPAAWTGERPDEPQLPIYAVTATQPPAAVLFAQLRTGDLRYLGVAGQGGLAPGIGVYAAPRGHPEAPQDWHALLALWQSALTALANEFLQGEARVDPQHGRNTCRQCHLQSLCRIHEHYAPEEEDANGRE
ncbi:MAG: PD-(D/E)XK nuclease family protein [Gammaproteobacteria bacterium]|nr:PD-(D/E)XK nuclease family protein [Gammaproteobacteria bacterium]